MAANMVDLPPAHSSPDALKRGLSNDLNEELTSKSLSVIVVGASGDLAHKKTFPSLYNLNCLGLLPEKTVVAGFARSKLEDAKYKKKISSSFNPKHGEEKKAEFLSRNHYFAGGYDSSESWQEFNNDLIEREAKAGGENGANRIYYLAIPPTIFVSVCKSIKENAMSISGWNRIIVEKPFGKDSESSDLLGRQLSALFTEDQLFRIDHYLGKEMVQNLMVMRFANQIYEPIWNANHIQSVVITFKENFGTKGRGGYFDSFGIIRDVMQNHLLQILSLVAMEPPVTLGAEDVRDEKVKLLRSIPPITMDDVVIGQYGPDPNGAETSYLDDPTVPNDSVTPTYACAVLHIKNSRWHGCPFVLKCGKALNERKAEIRIQFKKPKNNLFTDTSNNELVLRVQPDEAVYLKMSTKKPGLEGGVSHTELNLTYNERFQEQKDSKLELPDAYERLIFDVVRGDHNLFVRSDELTAAWNIFTPLLHHIEKEKIRPLIYQYGSRGPAEADALIEKYGFERTQKYSWRKPSIPHSL